MYKVNCFFKFSHKVTVVYSPYQALELIEKNQYDMMIVDYQMQVEKDGRRVYYNADELIPEIRKLENGKQLYVVLLTGVNDTVEKILNNIILETKSLFNANDMFLLLEHKIIEQRTGISSAPIYKALGQYEDKITDAEVLLNKYREIKGGKGLIII